MVPVMSPHLCLCRPAWVASCTGCGSTGTYFVKNRLNPRGRRHTSHFPDGGGGANVKACGQFKRRPRLQPFRAPRGFFPADQEDELEDAGGGAVVDTLHVGMFIVYIGNDEEERVARVASCDIGGVDLQVDPVAVYDTFLIRLKSCPSEPVSLDQVTSVLAPSQMQLLAIPATTVALLTARGNTTSYLTSCVVRMSDSLAHQLKKVHNCKRIRTAESVMQSFLQTPHPDNHPQFSAPHLPPGAASAKPPPLAPPSPCPVISTGATPAKSSHSSQSREVRGDDWSNELASASSGAVSVGVSEADPPLSETSTDEGDIIVHNSSTEKSSSAVPPAVPAPPVVFATCEGDDREELMKDTAATIAHLPAPSSSTHLPSGARVSPVQREKEGEAPASAPTVLSTDSLFSTALPSLTSEKWLADCTGCGKAGEYRAPRSSGISGPPSVASRHKRHNVTVNKISSYCGVFRLNPRLAAQSTSTSDSVDSSKASRSSSASATVPISTSSASSNSNSNSILTPGIASRSRSTRFSSGGSSPPKSKKRRATDRIKQLSGELLLFPLLLPPSQQTQSAADTETLLRCETCGKGCKNRQVLGAHRRRVHGVSGAGKVVATIFGADRGIGDGLYVESTATNINDVGIVGDDSIDSMAENFAGELLHHADGEGDGADAEVATNGVSVKEESPSAIVKSSCSGSSEHVSGGGAEVKATAEEISVPSPGHSLSPLSVIEAKVSVGDMSDSVLRTAPAADPAATVCNNLRAEENVAAECIVAVAPVLDTSLISGGQTDDSPSSSFNGSKKRCFEEKPVNGDTSQAFVSPSPASVNEKHHEPAEISVKRPRVSEAGEGANGHSRTDPLSS